MRFSATLAGLVAAAVAKEIPKDPVRAAELYDSGIMHERIMAAKAEQLQLSKQLNVLSSAAGPTYPELPFAQCKNGQAIPFRGQNDTVFRCNNVSTHNLKAAFS